MTIDLTKYRLPMQAITERMETAIQRGIEPGSFPEADRAPDLFNAWDRYADRSLRADDGRALVTCTTDMPGVTPAMIDWWFGWHLPLSERYQLWHPKAHLAARVKTTAVHSPGTGRSTSTTYLTSTNTSAQA